jgi:hypothetical protein
LDQKAASSPGNTHNAENMIELTAKRLQDSAQGFNPGYRFTFVSNPGLCLKH